MRRSAIGLVAGLEFSRKGVLVFLLAAFYHFGICRPSLFLFTTFAD